MINMGTVDRNAADAEQKDLATACTSDYESFDMMYNKITEKFITRVIESEQERLD